jgi:hypothetical protein
MEIIMFKKFGDAQPIENIMTVEDIDVKSVNRKLKIVRDRISKLAEEVGVLGAVDEVESSASIEPLSKSNDEADEKKSD